MWNFPDLYFTVNVLNIIGDNLQHFLRRGSYDLQMKHILLHNNIL